jgi:hypothetical protein
MVATPGKYRAVHDDIARRRNHDGTAAAAAVSAIDCVIRGATASARAANQRLQIEISVATLSAREEGLLPIAGVDISG